MPSRLTAALLGAALSCTGLGSAQAQYASDEAGYAVVSTYGYAGSAIRGDYVGAPLTRFPRPDGAPAGGAPAGRHAHPDGRGLGEAGRRPGGVDGRRARRHRDRPPSAGGPALTAIARSGGAKSPPEKVATS